MGGGGPCCWISLCRVRGAAADIDGRWSGDRGCSVIYPPTSLFFHYPPLNHTPATPPHPTLAPHLHTLPQLHAPTTSLQQMDKPRPPQPVLPAIPLLLLPSLPDFACLLFVILLCHTPRMRVRSRFTYTARLLLVTSPHIARSGHLPPLRPGRGLSILASLQSATPARL